MEFVRSPLRATLSICASLVFPVGARAADFDPNGIWMRGDGNAKVVIGSCPAEGDGKICATNLWIKDTSKGEATGDKLIMTLHRSAASQYEGDAYDPKRDRKYSIVMSVGADQMQTRGCVFFDLFCKSVSWARVSQ